MGGPTSDFNPSDYFSRVFGCSLLDCFSKDREGSFIKTRILGELLNAELLVRVLFLAKLFFRKVAFPLPISKFP